MGTPSQPRKGWFGQVPLWAKALFVLGIAALGFTAFLLWPTNLGYRVPEPSAAPAPQAPARRAPPPPRIIQTYSEQGDMAAGQYFDFKFPLNAPMRVVGQATLRGGTSIAISMTVLDPFKNVIVGPTAFNGTHGFAFTAASDGQYTIRFDNTGALFTGKAVDVQWEVWDR